MTSSSMCTDSTANVWQRIGCILSYSGNTADVVLNYCVLVINLVACIIISRTWQNTTKSRHTSALASLIFVILFQISLCLVVHCYGISIVWCAMAGWLISERKFLNDQWEGLQHRNGTTTSTTSSRQDDNDNTDPQDETQHHETRITQMTLLVILLDIGTIIYYVVVSALITTVAHIGAMVLGAILSELSQKIWNAAGDDDVSSTAVVPGTDPLLPAGHSVTTMSQSHPQPPSQLFVNYGL